MDELTGQFANAKGFDVVYVVGRWPQADDAWVCQPATLYPDSTVWDEELVRINGDQLTPCPIPWEEPLMGAWADRKPKDHPLPGYWKRAVC